MIKNTDIINNIREKYIDINRLTSEEIAEIKEPLRGRRKHQLVDEFVVALNDDYISPDEQTHFEERYRVEFSNNWDRSWVRFAIADYTSSFGGRKSTEQYSKLVRDVLGYDLQGLGQTELVEFYTKVCIHGGTEQERAVLDYLLANDQYRLIMDNRFPTSTKLKAMYQQAKTDNTQITRRDLSIIKSILESYPNGRHNFNFHLVPALDVIYILGENAKPLAGYLVRAACRSDNSAVFLKALVAIGLSREAEIEILKDIIEGGSGNDIKDVAFTRLLNLVPNQYDTLISLITDSSNVGFLTLAVTALLDRGIESDFIKNTLIKTKVSAPKNNQFFQFQVDSALELVGGASTMELANSALLTLEDEDWTIRNNAAHWINMANEDVLNFCTDRLSKYIFSESNPDVQRTLLECYTKVNPNKIKRIKQQAYAKIDKIISNLGSLDQSDIPALTAVLLLDIYNTEDIADNNWQQKLIRQKAQEQLEREIAQADADVLAAYNACLKSRNNQDNEKYRNIGILGSSDCLDNIYGGILTSSELDPSIMGGIAGIISVKGVQISSGGLGSRGTGRGGSSYPQYGFSGLGAKGRGNGVNRACHKGKEPGNYWQLREEFFEAHPGASIQKKDDYLFKSLLLLASMGRKSVNSYDVIRKLQSDRGNPITLAALFAADYVSDSERMVEVPCDTIKQPSGYGSGGGNFGYRN